MKRALKLMALAAVVSAPAQAGYPKGFGLGLKRPNNRYLNDEAVCQAATAMLSKIGLKAELDGMAVQNYWPELRWVTMN